MTDNRTTELLCCPFCGGEAEIIRNDIGVFIGCFNEDCPVGPATSTYVDGYATEAEAIAAWNARADSYTREDVESAFVSGYSLGTLPVGSDPRWDQNETTLEEEMEELGWVRKRTCHRFWTGAEMICSSCAHQLNDKTANYCPNCGSRVIG